MRNFWFFLVAVSAGSYITAQPQAALDSFIAGYVKQRDFNGTILVQQDDKIRYEKSFGTADRSFHIPLTNTTEYKIASVTKLFTSVLVLQLSEEGKISLHTPIINYLPGYTGKGGNTITIHQLLNHTSGLPNIDTISSIESALQNGAPVYQKPAEPEQLVKWYASGDPVAKPGTRFDYNNADYILLGWILEKIYRQPFDTILERKILKPLGLSHTGMLHQSLIVDSLARSYFLRPDINAIVPDLPVYYENWYAGGAMYSTVADLLKFSNAVFSGQLIKKETLDLLLTPGLDKYGYSMWIDEYTIGEKNYRAAKRPGQSMGSHAMLLRFLNTDLTVIILSNTLNLSLDKMVKDISIFVLSQ